MNKDFEELIIQKGRKIISEGLNTAQLTSDDLQILLLADKYMSKREKAESWQSMFEKAKPLAPIALKLLGG